MVWSDWIAERLAATPGGRFVARAHLGQADPRIEGRERARWLSVEPMAERVLVAYRELVAGSRP